MGKAVSPTLNLEVKREALWYPVGEEGEGESRKLGSRTKQSSSHQNRDTELPSARGKHPASVWDLSWEQTWERTNE